MCGLGQVTGFSESQVFFIYKMGAIGAGVIFQLVKHLPCEHENLNSSHRFYVKKKKSLVCLNPGSGGTGRRAGP